MSYELDPDDASLAAETLLRLAALIDPDDPEGLVDVFGQRHEALDALALSDDQFTVLRLPMYRADERARIAARLRVVAATIEGQLPLEARAIRHKTPFPR